MAGIPDATTMPVSVEWFFQEEFLFAADGDELLAGFPIESHVTEGVFSNGDRCFVANPRPWYERSHIRVDWSQELVASVDELLVELPERRVEPGSYFSDLDGDRWPLFERDAAGELVGVTVKVSYWVSCSDCEPTETLVTHRFERID